MSEERLFDSGLQPERTLLAWQRTALSLAVGCAVGVRLTAPDFGALAIVIGVISLGLVVVAYVGARFRYRRTHSLLSRSAALGSLSAWPLAAIAAATLTLGVLGAGYVLSARL